MPGFRSARGGFLSATASLRLALRATAIADARRWRRTADHLVRSRNNDFMGSYFSTT